MPSQPPARFRLCNPRPRYVWVGGRGNPQRRSDGMTRVAWRFWRIGPGLLSALVLCLFATADAAYAHGGAFGPPPRPEAKGPGGGSGPPSHVDPGFGGPIVTPGPGGVVTPRASKRKTPTTTTFETSWQLWWELNRLTQLDKSYRQLQRGVPEGKTGASHLCSSPRSR